MYDQTKKASRVHNICKFMSRKNDCAISTQSVLEFDFCYHLEYQRKIKNFVSQPDNYFCLINKKKSRYTPDFYVTFTDGTSCFYEVKYSGKINSEKFRKRFTTFREYFLKEHGQKLILVTEKQIRQKPLITNLQYIDRYCQLKKSDDLSIAILNFVREKKSAKMSEIVNYFNLCQYETRRIIAAFLADNEIMANIETTELGLDTKVWC